MKKVVRSVFHFLFDLVFARWFMRPIPSNGIQHVLISAYTGLGHFILRTAFVKKLEELYPDCRVTIIAGNSFGTEFVLNGYPTLLLNEESSGFAKLKFFLRMRKKKIDAAFFFCDASPSFLIRGCIIAGIPIRIGHVFEHIAVPFYYYTTQVPVRMDGVRSEIDMNLDLLEALHGKSFQREYRPVVEAGDDGRILGTFGLQNEPYICLQMGSSNGNPTTKRWLEGHFRSLILMLVEKHPELSIIALGDKGEAPIVNRICDGINATRLKNVAGKTTIEETKSLIFSCKVLICHDSGLLHLGNALGKNVITLYGPSNPDYYALNTPTCHILRKPCDCTPLLGLFPGMLGEPTEEEAAKKCPIPKCMERLTPEEVYAKCVELLHDVANSGSSRIG